MTSTMMKKKTRRIHPRDMARLLVESLAKAQGAAKEAEQAAEENGEEGEGGGTAVVSWTLNGWTCEDGQN
eukprot:CAMPEP_0185771916 /NCGR_PEP_ID=MMETSP1174-20130828/65878_1 /TAXON_ID=35687 /ORGANISM="Dictyocha speculum, Strain CCMP1381" /LENGTH=69 /DNA_ID=CAMNT_0028457941 /DNA_START=1 /DNA_END=210 /DNA_ORIENTATION=-